MANVTISLDDDTLRACREYARRNNTSLNAMIREMLHQRVLRSSAAWVDECLLLMDEAEGTSRGQPWSRDEIYGR